MIDAMVVEIGGKYYKVVRDDSEDPCDNCALGKDCEEHTYDLCTNLNSAFGDGSGNHSFKEVKASVSKDTVISIGSMVRCTDPYCCNGMKLGEVQKVLDVGKVSSRTGHRWYDVDDPGHSSWTRCSNCLEVVE